MLMYHIYAQWIFIHYFDKNITLYALCFTQYLYFNFYASAVDAQNKEVPKYIMLSDT